MSLPGGTWVWAALVSATTHGLGAAWALSQDHGHDLPESAEVVPITLRIVSPRPVSQVPPAVAPKVEGASLVKARRKRRRARRRPRQEAPVRPSPVPSAVTAINKGMHHSSPQGEFEVPSPVVGTAPAEAPQDDAAEDSGSEAEGVAGSAQPTTIDVGAIQSTALRAIQRAKYYPRAARRLGQEGTVIVIVYLAPNGDLARAPEVYRSSRFTTLDEAALAMVRRAAPLPLPPGVQLVDSLRFAIPIHFKLLDESYGASL